jgi:SP family sugar:H+ symporter-like MFS transporter
LNADRFSVWITSAEVGTLQLREKTLTLATFFGFGFNVLVTYVNPYMQNVGYGGLLGNVGFVYGGLSFLSFLWVVFYLPELKNRSLEELDELFQKKVSVWRFGKYQTSGLGHQITVAEKAHEKGEILEGIESTPDAVSEEVHTKV